jgi:hypothetical protein
VSGPGWDLTDALRVEYGSGVYWLHPGFATASVTAHFDRDGWAASVVDLEGATDKAGILEAFADGLAFPHWVGRNWDALDDALCDLSWWPAGVRGRVILVRGAEPDEVLARGDQRMLRDVLETAVASWAPTDSPLAVLLRPSNRADRATTMRS